MANQFDERTQTAGFDPAVSVGVPRAARDAGLRTHMLKVYNYMASAVLLTGIVALLFSELNLWTALFNMETGAPSMLFYVAVFGPVALSLFLQMRIYKLSMPAAQAMYWLYAASVGVAISTIFVVYTTTSIVQTFFAAAGAFMALSLYGYTTKKDLSGWGTFLMMGIWGVFLVSIANMFIQSSTIGWIASIVGVLVFAAFTAYRTQDIKNEYLQFAGHQDFLARAAIIGALHLYIAFMDIFLFLLRIFGSRE